MSSFGEIWQFLSTAWIIFVIGILWRLGGKGGYLGARYWRKIGAGIVLALWAVFLGGTPWYFAIAIPAAIFGATSLPLTLIGDSVKNAWWWLPIAGLADSGFVLLLAIPHNLLTAGLWMAWYSLSFTFVLFLSNFDLTSEETKHRSVEFFMGLQLGVIAWMVVFGGISL